jgi:hypothetical protein
MKRIPFIILIGFVLLTACTRSVITPPTPTQPAPTSTFTLPGTLTSSITTPPPSSLNICNDPQVLALIDSLKSAMLTSNGEILSSLISPAHGMDVRWVRNGNVITYTPVQAQYLFETTFEANWGTEPGSGLEKVGAFHDVIVPELVRIFNQSYMVHCNELKHGGATYELAWPYEGSFYSVHFPGTEGNGFLDWRTWVVGIEYADGKPYIYALMQFFREP